MVPETPNGTPAVMAMVASGSKRPDCFTSASAIRTMSSESLGSGLWRGYTPLVRTSWRRTVGLGVRATIGTRGRNRATRQAEHEQARINLAQVQDDIRLEVEEAYDRLLQAKRALDIQAETIAQAEEGLRIAGLRYRSGVGTQLEVLDAQAALTAARSALAEAEFAFRQARAGLKKATTLDIQQFIR